MIYLDMENSTLELKYNDISELKNFINQNIVDINSLNFKRIIFYCLSSDFYDIYTFLFSFKEYSCLTDFIIRGSFDNLNNLNLNDENIMIINTSNNIYDIDNVYNLVHLTKSNINKINNLLNEDINIIIKPQFDLNNLNSFNECLSEIYQKNIGKEILLDGYLIPTDLIKEHPCNLYLCDGWQCKKLISGLPKVISIEDNEVYFHGIINEMARMGTLKKSLKQFLSLYRNSESHIFFNKLCEKIFIKHVPHYPYDLFPLDLYLEREISYDN